MSTEVYTGRPYPLGATWDGTGYDFSATVNNLLTNPKSSVTFTHFYNKLIHQDIEAGECIPEKKSLIL
jgi:maltooligosyltrehalose synthase